MANERHDKPDNRQEEADNAHHYHETAKDFHAFSDAAQFLNVYTTA
jgi:hypothetical protein